MVIFSSSSIWLTVTRMAVILLTGLLGIVTYQSNLLLKKFQPDFNLLLSPPEMAVRIVLVGVCLFLAWLSDLPAGRLGLTMVNPLWSIGLGVGIGLVTQIVIYVATRWAINRFGPEIYSSLVIRNILPRRPIEWIPVSLAFIPAVAMEELLFRTLWLGGFGGSVSLSLLIVITSLIFGFMHLPQGLLGVIMTGGINVFFCLLFVWRGELIIPFMAHYTVNLVQLIVAAAQKEWLENY